MEEGHCNEEMEKIRWSSCDSVNTFIRAPAGAVNKICSGGGRNVGNNCFESIRTFTTITCVFNGGEPGNCKYRAVTEKGPIRVSCSNNNTVHYGC